jgi:predicted RNA-binding Zn ribbon-like protein
LKIAEAMGGLVCDKGFTLVRKCKGPACTLWFLDVSKAHARRWYSMVVCGNRAKAAHRARARLDAAEH